MNLIEQNAVLYYADFLSLQAISIPVTDNCKYFYIHDVPMNSCYILGMSPIYDEQNQYYQQAKQEYEYLRDKVGEDGVQTFIEDISYLKAGGSVTAERMLSCIHHFSNKKNRKEAFRTYNTWKNNKKYYHTTINDDGKVEEVECSMYIYHAERSLRQSGILTGDGQNPTRYENPLEESLLR